MSNLNSNINCIIANHYIIYNQFNVLYIRLYNNDIFNSEQCTAIKMMGMDMATKRMLWYNHIKRDIKLCMYTWITTIINFDMWQAKILEGVLLG